MVQPSDPRSGVDARSSCRAWLDEFRRRSGREGKGAQVAGHRALGDVEAEAQ